VRAAVLSDEGLAVRDWPSPEPGPGEARVAITKAGICGSDVHFAIDGGARTAFRPIVLGHEPAGRVDRLGPDTDGPAPGTRVAVVPMITCGACPNCVSGRTVTCAHRKVLGTDVHGCWADFLVVPARNLLPIPEGLGDALAAVATDAVATAYHATATRGGVGPGKAVAVWGVGGLGLCAVAIARHLGAAKVFAVDHARRRASAPSPPGQTRCSSPGARSAS
jgi:threonine dehydrogenase-like Zn-dependent dehydrogenase